MARDRATEGNSAPSSFRNWLYLLKRAHRKTWGKASTTSGAYNPGAFISLQIICDSLAFSLFVEQSKAAVGKVCGICTEVEVVSSVLQSEAEGELLS